MSCASLDFCDQGGRAKSADLSQRAECTDGPSFFSARVIPSLQGQHVPAQLR